MGIRGPDEGRCLIDPSAASETPSPDLQVWGIKFVYPTPASIDHLKIFMGVVVTALSVHTMSGRDAVRSVQLHLDLYCGR